MNNDKHTSLVSLSLSIVLGILMGLPCSSLAETETTSDGVTWTYYVSNGEASIYSQGSSSAAISTSTEGTLTIPDKLGGYPVTSLGSRAFLNCNNITNIILSSNITTIGYGAFYGCSKLTSVTIPEGVTSIGEAFIHSCTKLTQLVLPDSVVSISKYAFQNSGLTSIRIPPNVTSIGNYIFYNCSSLKFVALPRRFEGATSNLFIPSSATVVFYDMAVLSVVSPHGIAIPTVGTHQIETGFVVECSVNEIESIPSYDDERMRCSGWEGSGSVPNTGIGTNLTFTIQEDSTLCWMWKTQSLVSVSVAGGTCDFGSRWIDNGSIASVEIVPDYAAYRILLSGDTNGVTVANSVLTIPVNAPRSIVVTVESNEPKTETLNGVSWSYVISESKGHAILYGGDGVPSISPTTEGTIVVPASLGSYPVDEIGSDAFLNCNQLTRILFPGDAPDTVADDAFDGVDGNCTIHVRADADGWGDTFPGTWHGLTIMNDLCRLTTGVVGGGAVAGGGDFVSGDDAELIAYATDGFVFAYWTGDVASVSSNLTVTVVYDTTATAVFVPVAAADNLVQQRAEQNGYYTRDQIHELAIGNLMFDVDSGKARIGVKLMESSDLSDPNAWTPVELSASDLDVGEDGSVGMSVNAEGNVRFFRLAAP